tara:strand:+ start:4546 stop:6309 length:1764 start_codon:yes stop_codon:yes gene_type:complete
MVKSRVSKGTGVLLQQILDLTTALEVIKEASNHNYNSGAGNDELKKAYNLFHSRKTAFNRQVKKLKEELSEKELLDVNALLSGDYDKVSDLYKDALLNRYVPPAFKDRPMKGWRDIPKAELLTVIRDDYKLTGVGGAKFVNNDKHISALKERLENPIPLKEKKVTIVEPEKKEASGGASKEETGQLPKEQFGIPEGYKGAKESKAPEVGEEVVVPNPKYLRSPRGKHKKEKEQEEEEQAKMTVEDVPNPEPVKEPDAPYLPVGEDDVDSFTSATSKDETIATSNTKHQDGANSEFTLGDATLIGGATPLNTPDGSITSDPYAKSVSVNEMDINELRARLQSQEEVKKAVKTGVFQGFGTVDEVVVEEVSRTSGEMPTNPQEAVNMATGNEVEEEKARNKKDIERLKEEIRGLHKTFDVLIPALREKPHQLRFKSAMSSKDKKVVMKHHAEMLERVRLYFGGGGGNNLKVGVVVPLDAYMSSFFSGVNSGEGDISNVTQHTQPKGEHHSRGSGGKIVAKSIYYQRGGMSAVKGQAVSGHQVPSTLIKTRRGKVAEPLQVVDAPYEYVLNRKGTGSTKAVAGLKIKSKK